MQKNMREFMKSSNCTFLLFLVLALSAFGQSNNSRFKDIDNIKSIYHYVKEPFLYNIDIEVPWKLYDAYGNVLESSFGNSIKLELLTVNKYILVFDENSQNHDHSQCSHTSHPNALEINIIPYKILMDYSSLEIIPALKSGSLKGSELKVKCKFQHFKNKSISIKDLRIVGSGIEADIAGTISDENQTLFPGENILKFKLDGNIKSGTYIMLDFLFNNEFQSTYYHTEIIKN